MHTHINKNVQWRSYDMLGLLPPQFHGQFESLFQNLILPKCIRPSPLFKPAVITECPLTSRAVHMMTEPHSPIRPAAVHLTECWEDVTSASRFITTISYNQLFFNFFLNFQTHIILGKNKKKKRKSTFLHGHSMSLTWAPASFSGLHLTPQIWPKYPKK